MIFVPELTQHLTVIEPTGTTAGGLPVVLVNGVPYVVAEVTKPVARVFEQSSESTDISGRIGSEISSARQCANTVGPGLTTTEEWLHE